MRAGKILYAGVSDWPAWRVSQGDTLAALKGWTPFVALQVKYSLLDRTTERDLLPMARALDLAVAEEVKKIAVERGVSPAQVALNWARQQAGVIIPIVGARTEGQLRDNLGCLAFELDADELRRLDEISRVELGFPHEFLAKDNIREIIYGETLARIDNHRS